MKEIEITIKLKPSKMRWRSTWGSFRDEENNVVGGMNTSALEVEIEGKSFSIEAKEIWNAVAEKLGKENWMFVE